MFAVVHGILFGTIHKVIRMKQQYILGIVGAIAVGLAALVLWGNTATPSDTGENVPGVTDQAISDAFDTGEPTTNEPTSTMTEEENSEAVAGENGARPTAPASAEKGTTMVVLKTNKGDIAVELLTGELPVTAGNFLKLAQEDFYDGVKFHRVIDGFMIQGGDPLTKDDSMKARWGTGGPGYTIQDEFGPGYSNTPGTLSMANAGPNTGGSQFFINTANNGFLDGKHPVFGRVVSGMDVVTAISTTPTGPNDVPIDPVVIEDIVVQ